jgi:ABC-type cobalamin/Fe3+-siderophores transport system ATPase subunit
MYSSWHMHAQCTRCLLLTKPATYVVDALYGCRVLSVLAALARALMSVQVCVSKDINAAAAHLQ